MVEISLNGAENPAVTGPAASTGKNRGGKSLFPVGIFFMLFLIETIMAAGAAGAYFLYAGAGRISEIEADTRSHAVNLAEALGGAAELSYRAKNYSRLKKLFQEKIGERTIDEAFFILRSGKLIAHSDPQAEEKLKGTMAGGGSAYNLDLILQPVTSNSTGVLFTDYNIVSRPVPFERSQQDLIRHYLYRGIDSSGWLASRAVYGRKKPVGTVGFIISKTRIYAFIRDHVDRTLQVFRIALAAAFLVSLTVSLVVYARYRGIRRRALDERRSARPGADGELYDMSVAVAPVAGSERAIAVNMDDLVEEGSYDAVLAAGGSDRGTGRKIKDAIPADDKE